MFCGVLPEGFTEPPYGFSQGLPGYPEFYPLHGQNEEYFMVSSTRANIHSSVQVAGKCKIAEEAMRSLDFLIWYRIYFLYPEEIRVKRGYFRPGGD
jgi:hypothetical protein